MKAAELVEFSAWLDSLPIPQDDSCWDTIFLVPPRDLSFDILMAWFCMNFVRSTGDCHEEWKFHQWKCPC